LAWADDKVETYGKELFIPPKSLDKGDQIVKVDYKFEKKLLLCKLQGVFMLLFNNLYNVTTLMRT
jgi:hypothetical protein